MAWWHGDTKKSPKIAVILTSYKAIFGDVFEAVGLETDRRPAVKVTELEKMRLQAFSHWNGWFRSECSKPWLVVWYRGFYYQIVWRFTKSQYKDPYDPISIMECHKGFERSSSCSSCLGIFSFFCCNQKSFHISEKVKSCEFRVILVTSRVS